MPGPRKRRRSSLPPALAAASCVLALALAACGSSASNNTRGSSSNAQLALSMCMRAHGVPNYPDPTKGPGGEGFSISTSPGSDTLTVDGITFSGPVFQAAEKTCKLFGGGTAPPPISESQKIAQFHFAQCMRKHGVPNFPDPVFPASGGVERQSAPGLNRNSPAVQHAAAICDKA
ncbi:MAG TPA: hypothetical protein VG275_08885 [Solirubrobacteraceae bacterium]|nr:hypothetical protein [Solirubrobacteraceae bacterium]